MNKVFLIVVIVFLKVKIRKALCCTVTSSEDLLPLNCFKSYLCHLIWKFSNSSQFYFSLVKLIHMKCVFAFLYYAASFILVIAIALC